MSAYFVTGAGTEIGKTYLACALIRAWRGRGLACGALKPVVSGFDEEAPAGSDPALLLEALGREPSAENISRIAPWRFRAPLAAPLAAAAEGRDIDFEEVAAFCRARMLGDDVRLLIEGAGGVMSPLTGSETVLDLIAAIGAPVVFVAGSYLGAVSHALSGLAVLRVHELPVSAVVVSESRDSIGLDETRVLIERFVHQAAMFVAPRGDADGPWARALAEHLDGSNA